MNKPTGSRLKIIVTADDFGADHDVNAAILEAFQHNLISCASIMANMPGFEEACSLAREFHLENRIGAHVNLIEGIPLTTEIKECPRFCTSLGIFSGIKLRSAWALKPSERKAVRREVEAQVLACINKGLLPIHLDSHHHYHTSWPIGGVFVAVASKFKIKRIRLCGTHRRNLNWMRNLFVRIYNLRLRIFGLAKANAFASVPDIRASAPRLRGIVETAVHPVYGFSGAVFDSEAIQPLSDLLGSLPAYDPIICWSSPAAAISSY